MKRIFRFVFCIGAWIMMIFGIAGCSKAEFKINFIVDNSIYSSINTNGNETIKMPADPQKENYIFDGWYWDKDVWRTEFTAQSLLEIPLSSNMEVYAHFVDDSYLKGTEINIKNSTKLYIDGIGEAFYLNVKNNQLICKFNDYIEINPKSTWALSTDITGNNTIASKTVELIAGDNPLYYIYVTDKDQHHETYIVLIHRNSLFNVYFNSNGGSSCNAQEIEEGNYLNSIPSSTRKGYKFDRWNYDFKNHPITETTFVEALWIPNNYTITYDANGGIIDKKNQIVTYDHSYELYTPSKNGYTFKGWYDNKNNLYENRGFWTYDSNVSLKAKWETVEYKINYELNGGTSLGDLKTAYTINDSFTVPNAIKTGYTFKGWSLSSDLKDPSLNISFNNETGNKNLYAVWEANNYTITYDTNGAKPLEQNTQIVTYDKNETLIPIQREGYTFDGWYYGNNKMNSGTWNIPNDVTLIAKWTPIDYFISYSLDGGINDGNNKISYNIESSNFVILDPSKVGYTFLGWTSNDNITLTKNIVISKGSIGNLSLFANWKENDYTISLNVNNGNTLDNSTIIATFDKELTLPEPTRTGYTFNGWYSNEIEYINGVWNTPNDVELTAHWMPNIYTISYDANGGSVTSTSQSVTYDDNFLLKETIRTGYTFLRWLYNGEEFESGIWNLVTNITLVAEWEANKYNVTYDANGGEVNRESDIATFDCILNLPVPSRVGYSFVGWYSENILFESGKWNTPKDVELIANWSPNTNTPYVINHYQQNIYDDEYTLFATQELKGTTDTKVTPSVNSYTGFTSPKQQTANIEPDGSLVINYYYSRNSYFVKFITNGGESIETITQKYQSELVIPNAVRVEYTFGGWFEDVKLENEYGDTTMPAKDKTVYAWWREETKTSNFVYNGTKSIQLTGYNGTDKTVWIPSYIGDKPVKSIGAIFSAHSEIESLIIPETVDTIETGCLAPLRNLKELTIPFVPTITVNNKVIGISCLFGTCYSYNRSELSNYLYTSQSHPNGGYTFYNGNEVYIGDKFYCPPKSLTKIFISNATNIPTNAFYGMMYVEKVETTSITTSIGDYAFYKCTNLLEVILSNETTNIGQYAFYNCSSLNKLNSDEEGLLNIPSLLTKISYYCFAGCKDISKVTLGSNLTSIDQYAFSGCSLLREFNSDIDGELVVPSGVKTIGSYAFNNLPLITKVIFPNTVTSLEECALASCKSIIDLTIPFVPTSVSCLFGKCYSYNKSELSDYFYTAYNYYSGGSTMYNGNSVSIGNVFYCPPKSLTSICITNETNIPANAFTEMKYVEKIELSSMTTSIGEKAFFNCTRLEEISGSFSADIATNAFNGSGLLNKSGLIYVGTTLYKYNGTMPENYILNIKNGTKGISANAFSGCNGLTKVIFPNTLIKIGDSAFYNCASLTELEIPSSVLYIGANAFNGCSLLESVTIPFVGTGTGSSSTFTSVFDNVPNLVTVLVTSDCSIQKNAFKYCRNLQKISFASNVASIGDYAFYDCTSLESLIIPSTVESIGSYAFSGASNLGCFNMSNMDLLESIGKYAFNNCSSIEEIVIPTHVTKIGDHIFNGCGKLKSVIIFGNIAEICEFSFNSCTSLESVVFGESDIQNIGSYAFQNCSSLNTIYIPSSITYIGEYAFNGCSILVINCEAESIPEEWDYNWNPSGCLVNTNISSVND